MRPVPFGYKCNWYVVRSDDPAAVAKSIALRGQAEATWDDGIRLAYQNGVFVTPPIGEWVAIVGAMFHDYDGDCGDVATALNRLSESFGTAMLFGTHRVSGFCEWVRSEGGHITRAYSFCEGEELNEGPVTPGETQLGFGVPDESEELLEGEEPYWSPNERFVMQVAGKWCFNPQDLETRPEMAKAGLGISGESADLLP